jgi:hypothetical protein
MLTESVLQSRLSTDREFETGVFDTVFRNDAFIGLLPFKGVFGGDSGRKFNMVTSANSSAEQFSEGDSPQNTGNQTVVTATQSWLSWRIFIGETGHAMRDKINSGVMDGQDDAEFQLALKDLRDLMNTDLMGTAATGVLGLIDATTNFMDLSRTTYATLKAYVLDPGTNIAISTKYLNKADALCREAPYGSPGVELWLAASVQWGKIKELGSGKHAPGADGIGVYNPIPKAVDIGMGPMLPVPDLTNTVIIGLSRVGETWGYYSHQDGPGNVHIRQYGSQDDSEKIQIATSGCIGCTQPQWQVKIKDLSATWA